MCVYCCSCAFLKNDDSCTGFSLPGHLHKLLYGVLHLSWTSYLWSLAQEIPQSRPVAPPCAGQYDKYTVLAYLSAYVFVLVLQIIFSLILYLQVQNGVMIYTTWTTIATLINLTIVLTYNVKMDPTDAATISYSILAAVLVVW